jgi:hypothetical protein
MQITKTLWMLDYRAGEWSHLIPIYAVDEQEAWVQAYHWAVEHNMTLPEGATLVHFPHGFTVHKRVLPGRAEENR